MYLIDEKRLENCEFEIPITLERQDDSELHYGQDPYWYVCVDGVEWLQTKNQMHAVVLYNMMIDHLTEFMKYEKVK